MAKTDDDGSANEATLTPSLVSFAGTDNRGFERGQDDVWRYAGTSIPVPGAVDITLADQVRAREVCRPGEEPENVLLSLSELIANSRLGWVLQKGTRLDGAAEPLFLVPWAVWQEHADDPVDVSAPERDGEGPIRQLAIAEREARLRRHDLEVASAKRTEAVVIASALGMTRRAVAAVLGISSARVQQILDDAPESAHARAEHLVGDGDASRDG